MENPTTSIRPKILCFIDTIYLIGIEIVHLHQLLINLESRVYHVPSLPEYHAYLFGVYHFSGHIVSIT